MLNDLFGAAFSASSSPMHGSKLCALALCRRRRWYRRWWWRLLCRFLIICGTLQFNQTINLHRATITSTFAFPNKTVHLQIECSEQMTTRTTNNNFYSLCLSAVHFIKIPKEFVVLNDKKRMINNWTANAISDQVLDEKIKRFISIYSSIFERLFHCRFADNRYSF